MVTMSVRNDTFHVCHQTVIPAETWNVDFTVQLRTRFGVAMTDRDHLDDRSSSSDEEPCTLLWVAISDSVPLKFFW